MRKFHKMARRAATVAGIAVSTAALNAHAAIDTTAVETALADIGPAVTSVGGVLLAAAAVAVGFKWLKGTIFG